MVGGIRSCPYKKKETVKWMWSEDLADLNNRDKRKALKSP